MDHEISALQFRGIVPVVIGSYFIVVDDGYRVIIIPNLDAEFIHSPTTHVAAATPAIPMARLAHFAIRNEFCSIASMRRFLPYVLLHNDSDCLRLFPHTIYQKRTACKYSGNGKGAQTEGTQLQVKTRQIENIN